MQKKTTFSGSVQNQVYTRDRSKELDLLRAVYGIEDAKGDQTGNVNVQAQTSASSASSSLSAPYATRSVVQQQQQQQQRTESKTPLTSTSTSAASFTEPDVNAIDYWDTMKRLQQERTRKEYEQDLAKSKNKRALAERNIDVSLGLGLEASSSGSTKPSGKDDKVYDDSEQEAKSARVGKTLSTRSSLGNTSSTKSRPSAAENYNQSASRQRRLEELQSAYGSTFLDSSLASVLSAETETEGKYSPDQERQTSSGRANTSTGATNTFGTSQATSFGSNTGSTPIRDPRQILEERQSDFFKKWITEASALAIKYKMGGIVARRLQAADYDMLTNSNKRIKSTFVVYQDVRNNSLLRVGNDETVAGNDAVQILRPASNLQNVWTYLSITAREYVEYIVRGDVFKLVKSFMDKILERTDNPIACTGSFNSEPMWRWSDNRLGDPNVGISIDQVLLGRAKTRGAFEIVPEYVKIRTSETDIYILNHRRVEAMCNDIAAYGFTVAQWIRYSYTFKLLAAFQEQSGSLDIQSDQELYKARGYFKSNTLQGRWIGVLSVVFQKNAQNEVHLNDTVAAPKQIFVVDPDTKTEEPKTAAEIKAMIALGPGTTSTNSSVPLSPSSSPLPSGSGQTDSETSTATRATGGESLYDKFTGFFTSRRDKNTSTSSSLGESKGTEPSNESEDEVKDEAKRRATASIAEQEAAESKRIAEQAAAARQRDEQERQSQAESKARATEARKAQDAETARKARQEADAEAARNAAAVASEARARANAETARLASEAKATTDAENARLASETEQKEKSSKKTKKGQKGDESFVVPTDKTRLNFTLTNPPTLSTAARARIQQASEEWKEAKTLQDFVAALSGRREVFDTLYQSYLSSILYSPLWNRDIKNKVVQAQAYFSIVPLGKRRHPEAPARFEEIWNTTAPSNLTKELPYHLTGVSPDKNVPSAKPSVFNTILELIEKRISDNTKWIDYDAKGQFGAYAVFYTSPFICVFLSWCKQYVDILQQEIYPRSANESRVRYLDPTALFRSIERALFYALNGFSNTQLQKATCNMYYQGLASTFRESLYQTAADSKSKTKFVMIEESKFVNEKLDEDLNAFYDEKNEPQTATPEIRFTVVTLMKAVKASMKFKQSSPDQNFELVSNGADLLLDSGRFLNTGSQALSPSTGGPVDANSKQGYYGRRQFQIEASSAVDLFQRVTRGRLDMLAPKASQDASLLMSWLQSGVSVHFIDRSASKKSQKSGFKTPGNVLLYLLGDLQVSIQVAKSGRVVDVDIKDIVRIGTVVSETNTVMIESPNSIVAKISDFQDRDELYELYFIHKMPVLLVRMVDRTPSITSADSIADEEIDESQDQSYAKALEEIGYKGSALRNRTEEEEQGGGRGAGAGAEKAPLLGPGGRGQDLREWRYSFQEWWKRERETSLMNHYEYMNVYHDRTGSQERPNLFLHPEQFKLVQQDLQTLREQFATSVQRIFEVTTFDAETNKRLIEAQAELAIIQRDDGPLLERDPNRLHYMVSHLQNDGQYVRVLLPGITGHVLARVTSPYNAMERSVQVAIEGADPNDASEFGNLFFSPEQRQDLGNLTIAVAQISEWLPQRYYTDLGIGAERRLSPLHESALIDDLSALSPARKTIARTCLNRVWNSVQNKEWATRDKTLWDPLVSMLLQIVPGSIVDFVWFGNGAGSGDDDKTVFQGVLVNLDPSESGGDDGDFSSFYRSGERYFRVRITSVNGSTVALSDSASDMVIGMERLVPIVNIVAWRHAFQNHMDQFVAKAFRAQLYLFLLKIDAQKGRVKIANLSNFDDYDLARAVTHLSVVPRL